MPFLWSMKKLLLSFLIICAFHVSQAQELAITLAGDSVLLYEDGTWQYLDEYVYDETTVSDLVLPEILDYGKSFGTPSSSTKSSTSKNGKFVLNYDSKLWDSIAPGEINDIAELAFQEKTEGSYAMLIVENMPIPLESLTEIAAQNALDASPNAQVVSREYVTVNGKRMIQMIIQGTISGIDFTYFGLYYSDEASSVQYLSYTVTSIFEQNKANMQKLLSGFEVK
jgi:hypothetical protein